MRQNESMPVARPSGSSTNPATVPGRGSGLVRPSAAPERTRFGRARWHRGAAAVVAASLLLASMIAAGWNGWRLANHAGAAVEGGDGTMASPVRVLFLGHDSRLHDSGVLCPLLMEAFGQEAIYFDYSTSLDVLDPAILERYDALLLYANHDVISEEQFDALEGFIRGGGGFVAVHSASACFRNSMAYFRLLGARFRSHGDGVFGPKVVAPDHPALEGVERFEAWDETYVHQHAEPEDRTVLMVRREGDHEEPWTWVREHGEGRIFYTASGHDRRSWEQPGFQQMIRGGILWSVGDERRRQWQEFVDNRVEPKYEQRPDIPNYENRPQPLPYQFPLSPEDSMARTQVPAGYRLELFAAEPMIRNPIDMTWDERGRLWVIESVDYPNDLAADQRGNDSIKILEDTTGDGRADKVTVFADGLNIPTALVFVDDGLLVAQAPHFLLLRDTTGDDKADVRERVFTGMWGINDTHAGPSNLTLGIDNRYYGAVGYAGFRGRFNGADVRFSQGLYRFEPDGSAIEFLHQFTNNTWGLGFNAAGDLFGGTANNAPTFFCGLPLGLAPAGYQVQSAQRINRVDRAHAITPNIRQVDVFGGYTSAAGHRFAPPHLLPPHLATEFEAALICEPTVHLLALKLMRPDGAGYVAEDGFNLAASSDEWFSPVAAQVGPDNAIWVLDFYNFIIQHNPTPTRQRGGFAAETGPGNAHENPNRDNEHGRIYRIVPEFAAEPAVRSLADAGADDLLAALAEPNPFWRGTAQRLLLRDHADGPELPARLRAMVLDPESGLAGVHALWLLHGIGALDADEHRAALNAPDPVLRRNAVRALAGTDAAGELLFESAVITDSDLATRLAAFTVLAALPTSEELATLIQGLQGDEINRHDDWLAEALRLFQAVHGAGGWVEGPNLVTNESFEQLGGNGLPEGWAVRHYNGTAEHRIDETVARSGDRSLLLEGTGRGADTSVHMDLDVEPNTTYRLSGWIRTENVRGANGALLNLHTTEFRTPAISGTRDWTEVELVFNSGNLSRVSLNCLLGGWGQSRGRAWFDDIRLSPLVAEDSGADEVPVDGDPDRGRELFLHHPIAACSRCHAVGGEGGVVGPALDGIANEKSVEYLWASLVDPNADMAEGYPGEISPMPPMGLILRPQELADIMAYMLTLE